MTFDGIVFDFNGVLLWDAQIQVRAWQTVARDLRGKELSDEEIAMHVHGRPNSHILRYLIGRDATGKTLLDLIEVKESMYRDLCLQNSDSFVLSPGANSLLDSLVAAEIPRTIATASERTNLEFFVKHLELERWFDIERIVYDDGVIPGKPAPDMYLTAAHKIDLPPQRCVVVEDAISGFKAARAANIGYILGLGPAATHPRLLACDGVTAAIESLQQFPRELLLGRH